MDISNQVIDKLADLAKLEFDEKEREGVKADLVKILSFVNKLNEVNTDGVEPLIFMSTEVNVLREDVVHQVITHEEALLNAPAKDSDFFRVPRFLDK